MDFLLCGLNRCKNPGNIRFSRGIKARNNCSAVVYPPSKSTMSPRAVICIKVLDQYLRKNRPNFSLILAYWLFCGWASNSTKRLFWRLYRLFYWLFTIYPNAPCLTPKFCTIVVSISRKYYSRPKEIENNGDANFWEVKRCVMVHVKMVSSWFSIDVNRIQKRKELSVLLRFYFHEAMF